LTEIDHSGTKLGSKLQILKLRASDELLSMLFSTRLRQNHMGEMKYLGEFAAKLLGGPPYSFGS
jgi:hypothetical protein